MVYGVPLVCCTAGADGVAHRGCRRLYARDDDVPRVRRHGGTSGRSQDKQTLPSGCFGWCRAYARAAVGVAFLPLAARRRARWCRACGGRAAAARRRREGQARCALAWLWRRSCRLGAGGTNSAAVAACLSSSQSNLTHEPAAVLAREHECPSVGAGDRGKNPENTDDRGWLDMAFKREWIRKKSL